MFVRLFGPRWIEVPADPLTSSTHGEHRVEFVSRHVIAETGLICPTCGNDVAALGDYSLVRRSRLGEAIICLNKRVINDEEHTCGKILVASPDTEHGDNIIWDRVPASERDAVFHTFVRISKGDAARRKYGHDISLDSKGGLFATKPSDEAPAAPRTKLVLKAGQVWQVDDGRIVEIIKVQDHDPFFAGWGWCRFQNAPEVEWHVDHYGKIRQSMRDPTMNDSGRLITEVRSN